jgi:hypothetical protein
MYGKRILLRDIRECGPRTNFGISGKPVKRLALRLGQEDFQDERFTVTPVQKFHYFR